MKISNFEDKLVLKWKCLWRILFCLTVSVKTFKISKAFNIFLSLDLNTLLISIKIISHCYKNQTMERQILIPELTFVFISSRFYLPTKKQETDIDAGIHTNNGLNKIKWLAWWRYTIGGNWKKLILRISTQHTNPFRMVT